MHRLLKRWVLICSSLLCWASLNAQNLHQKIDITFENQSLEAALFQLMDEQNVPLLFKNDLLPQKNIHNTFRQYRLDEILDFLLRGTNLGFAVQNEAILIYLLPQVSEVMISGAVRSNTSGESIIGASVFLPELKQGTYTNEYGQFSLSVPPGNWILETSHIAHQSQIQRIKFQKDTTLQLKLDFSIRLEELTVWDSSLNRQVLPSDWDLDLINLEASKILPRLAGESDLIRSIHLLPGVQTGPDGIGGLFIRGGNAGHNLVLVDGVPVYNFNHAAGLLSVFNSSVLKTAKLHKGAYPARYEGRLSSVLDIRTREGNFNKMAGSAEVGLLSGKALLEGPLFSNGKSSFLMAGRWSFLNSYLEPQIRNYKQKQGEQGASRYNFYDLNGKLNYQISPKHKLFLSYYRGSDAFDNFGSKVDSFIVQEPQTQTQIPFLFRQEYNERVSWGNEILALRWNSEFHPKLFGNTTLTYSNLSLDFGFENKDSLSLRSPETLLNFGLDAGWYSSSIQDLAVKVDFDWHPHHDHYIRFGAKVGNIKFQPGILEYNASTQEFVEQGFQKNRPIHSNELAFYLENTQQIGTKWKLNYGLHLAQYFVEQQQYFTVQPRFSLYWQTGQAIALNASYRKTNQFLHLLSSSTIGLPTDLWVPSTGGIRPEVGHQVSMGSDLDLSPSWSLHVETYYKKMDHLLNYSEGVSFIDDWEENVTVGDGTAYGIDFQLKKKLGQTTGWISYSWSYTDRQFTFLNQGLSYPFKYDRRHDLKLALIHRFSNRFSASANFLFGTGLAVSLPTQQFVIQEPGTSEPPISVIDYGPKNQFRLPYYHRLDLGVNYQFQKWSLTHQIHLGVSNLYDRNNPLYYRLNKALSIQNSQLTDFREFVGVRLLPVLPSINYSINF